MKRDVDMVRRFSEFLGFMVCLLAVLLVAWGCVAVVDQIAIIIAG